MCKRNHVSLLILFLSMAFVFLATSNRDILTAYASEVLDEKIGAEGIEIDEVKDKAIPIRVGEEKSVYITNSDYVSSDYDDLTGVWYAFTPETSGTYRMEWFDQDIDDDSDPYIWMLNSNGYLSNSAWDEDDGNIVEELSAGETYYFLAAAYESKGWSKYKIRLKKDQVVVEDTKTIYSKPGETVVASMEEVMSGIAERISYQWFMWNKDEEEYIEILDATESAYSFVPDKEEEVVKCIIIEDGFEHECRFCIYSGSFLLEYDSKSFYEYGEEANLAVTCDTLDYDEDVIFKWFSVKYTFDGNVRTEERTMVSENSVPVTVENTGEFGKAVDYLPVEAKGYSEYECQVIQGTNTKTAVLSVTGKSMEVSYDSFSYNGQIGSPTTIKVNPSMKNGDTNVTYSYSWEVYLMENGKSIVFDESSPVVSGLDKNEVTIMPDRITTYYTSCRIVASTGESTVLFFNLYVYSSLYVETPTTNILTGSIGKEMQLSVEAESTSGEIDYKWYKGSVNEKKQIAGANGSSINVKLSSPVEEYYCIVSDSYKGKEGVYFVVMDPSNAEIADSKESALSIRLGETKLVSIKEGDTYNYLKFVPKESGKYLIYSNGDQEVDGYLLDGDEICENQMLTDPMSDDDALKLGLWECRNFAILQDLEAGKTYYIKSGYNYDDHVDTYYPVVVKSMDGKTDTTESPSGGNTNSDQKDQQNSTVHVHKPVKIAAKDSTENAEGNIEYWKCDGCGKYFTDSKCSKEIKLSDTVIAKKKSENVQTADPKTGTKNSPGVPEDKGSKLTDESTNTKVTVVSQKGETPAVSFTGLKDESVKSVKIGDTVKINGVKYKVTAVAADAFKGSKTENITLGKNIKSLAPGAFRGSKVKTITIKSKKLTKKSVKNSLKGCKAKKVTIRIKVGNKKLNKKYVAKYKKIFSKKNVGKKVVLK